MYIIWINPGFHIFNSQYFIILIFLLHDIVKNQMFCNYWNAKKAMQAHDLN